MRKFERIARIISLTEELSKLEPEIPLGPLLQKWVFKEAIEKRGDIFFPEDDLNEHLLSSAVSELKTKADIKPLAEERQKLLNTLMFIWERVPDQRFGQVLSNYGFGHFMSHPPKQMLQQSDEVVLKNLQSVKEKILD
eukprot:TRINITY_DN16453_c0_g1_i1.p1 TRINITY_DN16453_c0_g1~~TRINITY_DN16453_c0_g1_i1.p1  ORF type:complete len:145 (-),score=24.41 TRINITY_DN16453_c0_g1_i1:9-422(-)